MSKDDDDKARTKADRLAEALRANLRRRKAAAKTKAAKPEELGKP